MSLFEGKWSKDIWGQKRGRQIPDHKRHITRIMYHFGQYRRPLYNFKTKTQKYSKMVKEKLKNQENGALV